MGCNRAGCLKKIATLTEGERCTFYKQHFGKVEFDVCFYFFLDELGTLWIGIKVVVYSNILANGYGTVSSLY